MRSPPMIHTGKAIVDSFNQFPIFNKINNHGSSVRRENKRIILYHNFVFPDIQSDKIPLRSDNLTLVHKKPDKIRQKI